MFRQEDAAEGIALSFELQPTLLKLLTKPHSILKITSDYEAISSQVVARFILMRYNILACPCSTYSTLTYLLTQPSQVNRLMLQDIKEALGLTVELLDFQTASLSSALSPSHLVLFMIFHHFLVYSTSLVCKYAGEALGVLLGDESDSGMRTLVVFENVVLNDCGKGYLYLRHQHMRVVVPKGSELVPLPIPPTQSVSDNVFQRFSTKAYQLGIVSFNDEEERDLDDLFIEEDMDPFITKPTSSSFTKLAYSATLSSSAAPPSPLVLSSQLSAAAAPKMGSIIHSGSDITILYTYQAHPQQKAQDDVGLYTEYDQKSLTRGYRAYIPYTHERFSIYWYLAANVHLPPLPLPHPVTSETARTPWSLVVTAEVWTQDGAAGEVRVMPLSAVCKICVPSSRTGELEAKSPLAELVKALSLCQHIKGVGVEEWGGGGGREKRSRLGDDSGTAARVKLVTASALKKAKTATRRN